MATCKKRTTSEHTETSIQRAFYKAKGNNFRLSIPNIFATGNFGFESDILCIRKSGYTVEYEVKVSLADFRNDAKKTIAEPGSEPTVIEEPASWGIQRRYVYPEISKYELLRTGRMVANQFYYIMPRELAVKALPGLPEFAGLLALEEWGGFTELQGAVMLHKNKADEKQLLSYAGNLSTRYWGELMRGGYGA